MSHQFFDGTIYHKRFLPKKHEFTYKFFFLDIDLNNINSLQNKYFSMNKFNLFSFYTKDHFGSSDNLLTNVNDLLLKHSIDPTSQMRFITLPSIVGHVFNPISVLLLFKDAKPSFMFAEVHNYNGGRVIYPVTLSSNDSKHYKGEGQKDMYVSPFFDRDGTYTFDLVYDENHLTLSIQLYKDGDKMLVSNFSGISKEFSTKSIKSLFLKHTLLTVWVVTRTLYQSMKLKLKGLQWESPQEKDTKKRF